MNALRGGAWTERKMYELSPAVALVAMREGRQLTVTIFFGIKDLAALSEESG